LIHVLQAFQLPSKKRGLNVHRIRNGSVLETSFHMMPLSLRDTLPPNMTEVPNSLNDTNVSIAKEKHTQNSNTAETPPRSSTFLLSKKTKTHPRTYSRDSTLFPYIHPPAHFPFPALPCFFSLYVSWIYGRGAGCG
jgi:hypothetical protein